MSLLEVNKITPQSGTTLTLGDTGDTINFGSGVLPNFENLTVTGDLTVDTNSLKVDSTNNYVGIGIASPQKMLHILNTATTGVTSTTPIHLRLEGNNSNYYDIGRDNQNTGFLSFYGNQSGANGYIFGGVNGERMRIDSSGNVVLNSSPASTSDNISLRITGGTAGYSNVQFADSADTNVGMIQYNHASNYMQFTTNDSERMRITSSGNVGIGTSAPSALLHLKANAPYITFEDDDNNQDWQIQATAWFAFRNQTTNSEVMRIDSSGQVGIGTSSPSAELHISKSADAGNAEFLIENSFVTAGSTDETVQIQGRFGGYDASYIRTGKEADFTTSGNRSSFMSFWTRGAGTLAEAMRINSSGTLMVGKTSSDVDTSGFEVASNGNGSFCRSNNLALYLVRNSSDGEIVQFRKDGASVGNIGSYLGSGVSQFYISGADTGFKINSTVDVIGPSNASGSNRDNAITLGDSGNRFKDLYLGGNIYLGGTGSANALDDYEEGTWTPTISGTSSAPTYFNRAGTYTKVGNLVTATLFLQTNAVSFSNNNDPLKITGYPFTPTGNTGYGFFIGSLSSQTFYYNGSYNDYGTNGVCHPEFQAVDSTIRFIVTASGGIRGTVKNLGMTVSGLVLQCWFQHYAT